MQGRAAGARPLRVPVLLFLHTIFLKRRGIGNWMSPYEVGAPPVGNPGTPTELHKIT